MVISTTASLYELSLNKCTSIVQQIYEEELIDCVFLPDVQVSSWRLRCRKTTPPPPRAKCYLLNVSLLLPCKLQSQIVGLEISTLSTPAFAFPYTISIRQAWILRYPIEYTLYEQAFTETALCILSWHWYIWQYHTVFFVLYTATCW
jgi:hypothetical protein